MNYDFEKGAVLLVNKPLEWTSFDVVNKLRYAIKRKINEGITDPAQPRKKIKVGHAGTLDPLATGLLIVCTGKETKNIDRYMGLEKEYTGTFFLGSSTPSYDRETAVDNHFETGHITEDLIRACAQTFIGEQGQVPPVFSAIKKDGTKAYLIARSGKTLQLEPRSIIIREFEIIGIEMPLVHFRVLCSKGTYIRSLAHDFGKALQSGAYLHQLCRTQIGSYNLRDAKSLEELIVKLNS